jgi:hypothetical protein
MSGRRFEKVKEAYRNMKMFIDILKIKGDKYLKTGDDDDLEEMREILKMQHQSNRYFLEDLGIKFDETGVIKNLNKKIEDLESRLESKVENSPSIISQYITNISDGLSDKILEEFGVRVAVDIKVSNSMSVVLSLFRIEKGITATDKMLSRTDEELKERFLMNQKNLLKAESSLDLFESDFNKDFKIRFTDSNKNKFENLLSKEMSPYGLVINTEFGVRLEMDRDKGV